MELTRRELVAAFLGSAVAASACRKTAPREPVPGALVDRVVDTGHRLRAGPLPLAAEAQTVDVLVVGGGVAGLSAAWRLAAAGVKDVRVLELDAEAGARRARGGTRCPPTRGARTTCRRPWWTGAR
ncbi:FAD-dependent oxidoreductase [Cystobacter fuscus]